MRIIISNRLAQIVSERIGVRVQVHALPKGISERHLRNTDTHCKPLLNSPTLLNIMFVCIGVTNRPRLLNVWCSLINQSSNHALLIIFAITIPGTLLIITPCWYLFKYQIYSELPKSNNTKIHTFCHGIFKLYMNARTIVCTLFHLQTA